MWIARLGQDDWLNQKEGSVKMKVRVAAKTVNTHSHVLTANAGGGATVHDEAHNCLPASTASVLLGHWVLRTAPATASNTHTKLVPCNCTLILVQKCVYCDILFI
jgi:Na+/H+ antiporter NhaB